MTENTSVASKAASASSTDLAIPGKRSSKARIVTWRRLAVAAGKQQAAHRMKMTLDTSLRRSIGQSSDALAATSITTARALTNKPTRPTVASELANDPTARSIAWISRFSSPNTISPASGARLFEATATWTARCLHYLVPSSDRTWPITALNVVHSFSFAGLSARQLEITVFVA